MGNATDTRRSVQDLKTPNSRFEMTTVATGACTSPTTMVTEAATQRRPGVGAWRRLQDLSHKIRRLQNELSRCYAELETGVSSAAKAGPPRRSRFKASAQSLPGVDHPPVETLTKSPRDAQALETVCLLANVMEARDPYVAGHSRRVAFLARITGEALDWPAEQVGMLEWAGLLHDVGKIGISERILQKPDQLSEAERREVQRHPRLSHDLLKTVAGLAPVLSSVLHHHENLDGSGYPDGLRGAEIPPAARILRVADTFDALTSTRPYRDRLSVEAALDYLRSAAGAATDPIVTDVFVDTIRSRINERDPEFRDLFRHLDGGGVSSVTEGLAHV